MAPSSTTNATIGTNRRCRAVFILTPVYSLRRRSVPDRACRSRTGILFSGRLLVAERRHPDGKDRSRNVRPQGAARRRSVPDGLPPGRCRRRRGPRGDRPRAAGRAPRRAGGGGGGGWGDAGEEGGGEGGGDAAGARRGAGAARAGLLWPAARGEDPGGTPGVLPPRRAVAAPTP